MLPAGGLPATSSVHYTTSCNTQSSAPEDGQNNCPKHVELIGIINKPLLLHLVGWLQYLYQWRTVKQILDNEIYFLIKYTKSFLWRVAKRLSYIEDTRCLKDKVPNLGQKVALVTTVTLHIRSGLGPCCRYTEQCCTTPAANTAKTDNPHDHIFN